MDTNGIITTIAGNGQAGYSGDGGPATQASLNWPYGLSIDTAENIFIADGDNNRIRKVDTNGIITTIAGTGQWGFSGDGGPATQAALSAWGVNVDTAGNIYIADGVNNRIRKVDTNGTITTIAGNGQEGFSGDGFPATFASISPAGVFVDNTGTIYIADVYNYRIRKVVFPGSIVSVFTVSTTSLPSGTVGTAYSQTLTATGGQTPYTWTITAGALPSGLTLNGTTGMISGTPTAGGTSNVTVKVADANNATATGALSITILSTSATGATLSPSVASPQVTGTSVLFTAGGVGGSGTYEYQYWLNTGGTWTVTQNYSANNTWTWNTTGLAAGSYGVRVYVRNVGSPMPYEAAKGITYKLE